MGNPRWRKVAGDLRGSKARTALVVLSIALGATAIGLILAARSIITSEVDRQFMDITPPSAVLVTTPLDPGIADQVRELPGVAAVDTRELQAARIRDADGDWHNLRLYVPATYEQFDVSEIRPESGAWPPSDGEILLERSSIDVLGLDPGDDIAIQGPGGEQLDVELTGSVHDLFQISTQFLGEAYAYTTPATLARLDSDGRMEEIAIVAADEPYTRESAREVTVQARDDVIEPAGHTVISTLVRDPGVHNMAWVVDPLLLLLGILGVLALLLATALVVSTVSALVARQTRDIGVMKALGGRRSQLVVMYLSLAAVYGLVALVIAIPAGAIGAWFLSRFALQLINFDAGGVELSPGVIAIQVAVGIVLPVAAAAVPVLRGTGISVREAIASYGTTTTGHGAVARAVERIRGVPRPVALALRNTFRRGTRLTLTLVTLTLAGAIFISVLSLRDSLIATLDDVAGYWAYDVEVNFEEPQDIDAVTAAAADIGGVTGAEGWAVKNGFYIRPDGTEHENIDIYGPPADSTFVRPTLVEGRWVEGPGEIAVNADFTREEPAVAIGDTIPLRIEGALLELEVVGEVTSQLTGPSVYLAYAGLAGPTGEQGQASRAVFGIEGEGAEAQDAAADALEQELRALGFPVSSVTTHAELRSMTGDLFALLITFLAVMAVLLAVVGGLNLMGTMTLNVLERTREIGIMRSIGATDGAVLQVIMIEGLVIGVLAWVLAGVLSVPLGLFMGNAIGDAFLRNPLTHAFSAWGLFGWLAISLVIAALATFLPARHASRLTIRETIGYE